MLLSHQCHVKLLRNLLKQKLTQCLSVFWSLVAPRLLGWKPQHELLSNVTLALWSTAELTRRGWQTLVIQQLQVLRMMKWNKTLFTFYSSYIQTTVPLPTLLLQLHHPPTLPAANPPTSPPPNQPIHSPERVRPPMGGQESLAYQVEPGPNPAQPHQGWARRRITWTRGQEHHGETPRDSWREPLGPHGLWPYTWGACRGPT